MLVKKRHLLFAGLGALSLIVGTLCFTLNRQHKFERAVGNDEPYVLELSRSLDASEVSAGQASFNTSKNNAIVFKFASASVDSGLVSLATGGYFYNDTAITGISKIEATLTSGSATLSYGNAKNVLTVGSEELSGVSLITVNFAEPSDYFRIDDITGPLAIASLRITYACANDYQYAYDLETASGDLLTESIIQSQSAFNDDISFDSWSFETSSLSSGFAWHVKANESYNNWPSVQIKLPKSYDLSHSSISIMAKFTTTKPRVSFKLYNSSLEVVSYGWQTAIDFLGAESYTDLLDWTRGTVTNANMVAALQAGKDLSDVRYIDIGYDFNANHGIEQNVFVDELHFEDAPYAPNASSGNNLEMCTYSAGQWRGYNSTPSVVYDTYGASSGSALKVTFQDTTATLPGRVYASFDLAQTAVFGTSNAIDVKNSTLSFDIKLSQEFYDAANSQFTFKHEDSSWSGIEKWYNYTGYNSGNPDTWLHISIDLSAKYGSETRNANTYCITFGFFGMDSTKIQTAWVIIDNLAMTANS